MYWGVEEQIHAFLTSAKDRSEWSASRPNCKIKTDYISPRPSGKWIHLKYLTVITSAGGDHGLGKHKIQTGDGRDQRVYKWKPSPRWHWNIKKQL